MAEEQKAVTASDTQRRLEPLSTGTRIHVQNQASIQWDWTGVITGLAILPVYHQARQ